jgi:hypothetical protein
VKPAVAEPLAPAELELGERDERVRARQLGDGRLARPALLRHRRAEAARARQLRQPVASGDALGDVEQRRARISRLARRA